MIPFESIRRGILLKAGLAHAIYRASIFALLLFWIMSVSALADDPKMDYPLPDETVTTDFVKAGEKPVNKAVLVKQHESYILQPGNRIKVTIYPEDEYIKGGDIEVSSDGYITLPLVGKIQVLGLSVREVEGTLTALVDQDYLVNPEVVIEVTEQTEREVMFLGAVKQPGAVPFPKGTAHFTLLQALSEVGGFSDVANIKKVKIVRDANGEKQVLRANVEAIISGNDPDIELQSGDIVHVAESLF